MNELPKRYNPQARIARISRLIKRDGNICEYCKKVLIPNKSKEDLVKYTHADLEREIHDLLLNIDHKDGNPKNRDITNERLLHHICNTRAYHKTATATTATVTRERERMGMTAIQAAGNIPTTEDGYSAVVKHKLKKPHRLWIFVRLQATYRNGEYPTFEGLVADSVMFFGISEETAARWLNSMLKGELFSPLTEGRDTKGNPYIKFRDDHNYTLNPEQLLNDFPVEGIRETWNKPQESNANA